MASTQKNRPFKFGSHDRVEYIVYNSETMILCQNDLLGNPIYIGRAKAGSKIDENVWEISFMTYDATSSLLSKEWPISDKGVPSTDYEFIWDDRATYIYE
jgi:hypothetical protein